MYIQSHERYFVLPQPQMKLTISLTIRQNQIIFLILKNFFPLPY